MWIENRSSATEKAYLYLSAIICGLRPRRWTAGKAEATVQHYEALMDWKATRVHTAVNMQLGRAANQRIFGLVWILRQGGGRQ
jgi:hypothetical protein